MKITTDPAIKKKKRKKMTEREKETKNEEQKKQFSPVFTNHFRRPDRFERSGFVLNRN